MQFVIFAPKYRETNGGAIALHRLCHLINANGGNASIFPYFSSYIVSQHSYFRRFFKMLGKQVSHDRSFTQNQDWNTPLCNLTLAEIREREDVVVVYDEITLSNPLGAKNVARWLLHNPGFHSGSVCFTRGEVLFKFGKWVADISLPYIEASKIVLTATSVPWGEYDAEVPGAENTTRSGIAYCLRKGTNRVALDQLKDGRLIDGLTHKETAKIFKEVKTFVSYDTRTFYSKLAMLSGCDSVVIPERGVSIDQWDPDGDFRLGVAYGWSDLPRARQTAIEARDCLRRQEEMSELSVKSFMNFWLERLAG